MHKLVPRLLITLLGIALILMATFEVVLGMAGASAMATVNSIRREGGERTDGKPGRYTYNIGYSFTLPNGKEVNGFAKKIGDSVYLKADGSSFVQIRYFPAFPYINAMDQDTKFGARQLVLVLAGGTLIVLINKKKGGHSSDPSRPG